MKKTVITVILTALVTETLVTHLHNHQLKARMKTAPPGKPLVKKQPNEMYVLKRAASQVAHREHYGEYIGCPPERMVEDLDFEIIIGRNFM